MSHKNHFGRDYFGPANDNITPEDTDATPTLQDFFFTFGDNHGVNRDGWIKISAPSVSDARAAMWLLHGAKWAFCYTPELFKSEYFPAGELAHFRFIPLRSIPVLLNKVDEYNPLTEDYSIGTGDF